MRLPAAENGLASGHNIFIRIRGVKGNDTSITENVDFVYCHVLYDSIHFQHLFQPIQAEGENYESTYGRIGIYTDDDSRIDYLFCCFQRADSIKQWGK